jgi:hypothetical protein
MIRLLNAVRNRDETTELASMSLRRRVLAAVRRDATPPLELRASEQLGERPD